jgi:restriction endonuclease S subunit
LKVNTDLFLPKCFYYLVQLVDIENKDKYERHFKYLSNAKIPKIPTDIQELIIKECELIEKNEVKSISEIAKLKSQKDIIINNIYSQNYKQDKLSNLSIINPSKTEIRAIEDEIVVSSIEMASVNEKGFITNKVDKTLKDLRKGSYTYFRDNDIIIAKITPCMENGKCAIAQGLSNGIGMGSSEFHVIRTNETINNKFLFSILNRESVRKEAEKNMTGSSGHRRVPASYYENFKVPVPSIKEQEKIVKQIEILEQTILAEQAKIDSSEDKKKEVVKKYL